MIHDPHRLSIRFSSPHYLSDESSSSSSSSFSEFVSLDSSRWSSTDFFLGSRLSFNFPALWSRTRCTRSSSPHVFVCSGYSLSFWLKGNTFACLPSTGLGKLFWVGLVWPVESEWAGKKNIHFSQLIILLSFWVIFFPCKMIESSKCLKIASLTVVCVHGCYYDFAE